MLIQRALRRVRIWRSYRQLHHMMEQSRKDAVTRIYVYTDWLAHYSMHVLPKHHDFLALPDHIQQQLKAQEQKERAVGE